jgi:hypothetical protein
MNHYEDAVIRLDESGVTVKSRARPERPRHIPYTQIIAAETVELKIGTGRFRLIGISPGRPRDWFHWDRSRSDKTTGIRLDLGRFFRIVITPDDPQAVLEAIRTRMTQGAI